MPAHRPARRLLLSVLLPALVAALTVAPAGPVAAQNRPEREAQLARLPRGGQLAPPPARPPRAQAAALGAQLTETMRAVGVAADALQAAIDQAVRARGDLGAAQLVDNRHEEFGTAAVAAHEVLREAQALQSDPAVQVLTQFLDRVEPMYEAARTTILEAAVPEPGPLGDRVVPAAEIGKRMLAVVSMWRLAARTGGADPSSAARADAYLAGGTAVLAAWAGADPDVDGASRAWGRGRSGWLWRVLAEADAELDPAMRASRWQTVRAVTHEILEEAVRVLTAAETARGVQPVPEPEEPITVPGPVRVEPPADPAMRAVTDQVLAQQYAALRKSAAGWRGRAPWDRVAAGITAAILNSPSKPTWAERDEQLADEADKQAERVSAELLRRVAAVTAALTEAEQARQLASDRAREQASEARMQAFMRADAELADGVEAAGAIAEAAGVLDGDAARVLRAWVIRLDRMRAAEAELLAPVGLDPSDVGESGTRLRNVARLIADGRHELPLAGQRAERARLDELEAREAYLVAGAAELARQVARTSPDPTWQAWGTARARRLARILGEADTIPVAGTRAAARTAVVDLAIRVIEAALPLLDGSAPPPPGADPAAGAGPGAGPGAGAGRGAGPGAGPGGPGGGGGGGSPSGSAPGGAAVGGPAEGARVLTVTPATAQSPEQAAATATGSGATTGPPAHSQADEGVAPLANPGAITVKSQPAAVEVRSAPQRVRPAPAPRPEEIVVRGPTARSAAASAGTPAGAMERQAPPAPAPATTSGSAPAANPAPVTAYVQQAEPLQVPSPLEQALEQAPGPAARTAEPLGPGAPGAGTVNRKVAELFGREPSGVDVDAVGGFLTGEVGTGEVDVPALGGTRLRLP